MLRETSVTISSWFIILLIIGSPKPIIRESGQYFRLNIPHMWFFMYGTCFNAKMYIINDLQVISETETAGQTPSTKCESSKISLLDV